MAPASKTISRYVDTTFGQLHVTECGTGFPVVLLHWVPLSGRLYEAELPAFGELGFRALAPDLIGFGRSAKSDQMLTFDQHAQSVAQALSEIGIRRFALLGGHFSVPVALEITRMPNVEVVALTLDGCAHLLPAEAQAAIAAQTGRLAGPGLHPDGSHRSFLWDQAVNTYRIFDPTFELTEKTVPLLYRFMIDYLSTGPAVDFGSFAPFPAAARLGEVVCRTLVITAEQDPLRAAYEPTLLATGECGSGLVMRGCHPLHDPDRSGEYAAELSTFFKDCMRDDSD